MKKFLLTSALILALVVSVTAGTMAAYTQGVATFSSDVHTKKFEIITNGTDTFGDKFSIAPGDTIVKKIVLKNAGEVATKVFVNADLIYGSNPRPQGMNFNLQRLDGESGTVGHANYWSKLEDELGVNETGTYKLTITWDYEKDFLQDGTLYTGQNSQANKEYAFNVVVNAVQANEANVYGTAVDA